MHIYMSSHANEASQEELMNTCELIPPSSWGGTLKDCGLKEQYVLFFTNKTQTKKGAADNRVVPIKRETSHVRSSGANTTNGQSVN